MTPREFRRISEKPLDVIELQVDRWIRDNKNSQPQLAAAFEKRLTRKPVCQWLGGWNKDPRRRAEELARHAETNGALYQVVLYNIVNRDCGGLSVGGAASGETYLRWVQEVSLGLGFTEGIIIVEPDALAFADQFDVLKKEERVSLLREAVKLLKLNCKNAHIYLDVGHPGWVNPEAAKELFVKAGGTFTRGVSVNISNSYRTQDCLEYGSKIVNKVSSHHGVVIDISRNGAGPPPAWITGTDRWANAPSNRLGSCPALYPPGMSAGYRLHAVLWVKVPGESDGEYNGAPPPGQFWSEGAMKLLL